MPKLNLDWQSRYQILVVGSNPIVLSILHKFVQDFNIV
jgi:hypothetical protein